MQLSIRYFRNHVRGSVTFPISSKILEMFFQISRYKIEILRTWSDTNKDNTNFKYVNWSSALHFRPNKKFRILISFIVNQNILIFMWIFDIHSDPFRDGECFNALRWCLHLLLYSSHSMILQLQKHNIKLHCKDRLPVGLLNYDQIIFWTDLMLNNIKSACSMNLCKAGFSFARFGISHF